MSNSALIIVDPQNDFCPGGTLAVPEGDHIVPVVNSAIEMFVAGGRPIYITRDWHPADHVSFVDQGGIWPPHCVQETAGAQFHPDLEVPDNATIVTKGYLQGVDAYSGFDGTDLADNLRSANIDEVVVCGLATDYCVKATVIDALEAGFKVRLLVNGIRGVEVNEGDSDLAIVEMTNKGAQLISSPSP